MKLVILLAAILLILGISLILYVVFIAIKLKSSHKKKIITDADLREKVGKLVPVNLAGLFLSIFGIIILFIARILG